MFTLRVYDKQGKLIYCTKFKCEAQANAAAQYWKGNVTTVVTQGRAA